MNGFLLAFAVSAICTLLLVRWRALARRGVDDDFDKPQGFHAVAVPRIGGLGIVLGVLASALLLEWRQGGTPAHTSLLLLGCAVPAFAAGFAQDFTDAVSPRGRLIASGVSAMLAFHVLDAAVRETAIPGIDWIVAFSLGSLVTTVVAVAGVANSINIIDGFNGLASMCVMLMLAALGYVAHEANDALILAMALAGIGAVLGFFIWNFPAGLIFLGDGGAYFLGFYAAELAILLVARNSTVSPLLPLLVCIYPAFETLFSIYRRWVLRQQPAHVADGIHLHSLIHRRLLRWAVGNQSAKALTRRNSMTSPYLWLLSAASLVPAVLFWDTTWVLALALLLFGITYSALYWRIVRFRSPRWLTIRPRSGSVRVRASRGRS